MNVVENIKRIRLEKSINQELIAEALGVDVSVISNIEKGKRELKVSELDKIANVLREDVLYLFTYPKRFVDKTSIEDNHDRISITFEVSADKREHLLKLVTGEKRVE
ncbi:helix-turn-helix domain-containing protein [Capnocytophaga canis]|uniref:helix-turn-helix domain-containing protein n=1 Tax=Capnocytophaga canis TaxID=1848903 RepID=UPI001561E3DE|nr:helix-turn-helix transcriptional regulator [Capnocytophaga canis]